MKSTVVLFVLGLCPISAYAQTLFTTVSEYGLPVSLSITEINQTGTLAKFDSNLGTLTGATLTIYGGAEFDMVATNGSVQNQTAKITSTTSLIFSSSEGAVASLIQAQNPELTLTASTPLTAYSPHQTIEFGPYSKSSSVSYDLASVLSSVQASGGGSFTVNTQSLSGFSIFGGGGNLDGSQDTKAGAGARITYTYTIPESSSAIFAAFAGLTWCLCRKRTA